MARTTVRTAAAVNRRRALIAAVTTAALLSVGASAASAQTTAWIGGVGGAWGDAANWSAGVPTAADDVQLPGGASIADVPEAASVASLSADADGASLASVAGAPATLTVTGDLAATKLALDGVTLALTDTTVTTIAAGDGLSIAGSAQLAGALVVDEGAGLASVPKGGATTRVLDATTLTGSFDAVTRATDNGAPRDGRYYTTRADADAASVTAHDPFVTPTGGIFYPGNATTVTVANFAPGEQVTVDVWIGRAGLKGGPETGVIAEAIATASAEGVARVELPLPVTTPDSGPGSIYATGATSGVVAKYVTIFRPVPVTRVSPAFDVNADGVIDTLQ